MENEKSPGVDGLPTKFYKNFFENTIYNLAHMVQSHCSTIIK